MRLLTSLCLLSLLAGCGSELPVTEAERRHAAILHQATMANTQLAQIQQTLTILRQELVMRAVAAPTETGERKTVE
jgi:hypothetical protein